MENTAEWCVTASQAGERLDVFVAGAMSGASRGEAQRLIALPETQTEGIRVNGARAKANYKLRIGDVVTAQRAAPVPTMVEAQAIPISIVYEDGDVLVIDKPRGMVVHPAPGSTQGTLVNAVLAHADDLSGIGGELRPGIVHRLDKDTGGLLMIAKNDQSHRNLQEQIQSRTAERRYLALVWGQTKFERATIDAPIGRHPTDRKRMAVLTDPRYTAREAQTELTVQARYDGVFTLVEAKLQTGRTHQIRVHSAYIQHPIVGDATYGGIRKLPANVWAGERQSSIEQAIADLHGQALHAYSLAFSHPSTGERLAFTVPLPPPMQTLLDLLAA